MDQVREIVRHGKYAPLGNRGFGATRRDCWGQEADPNLTMPEMLAAHNRETLLIPQCETVGCLEHIEEITALDGVDGIFIGPFDLSIALGIPGQLESPEFIAAITKVLNACKKSGKQSFIFAKTTESARCYLDMGFDSATYGMDISVLMDAVHRDIQEIKR